MKRTTILFFWLALPLFCMAQGLPRIYEYDNAGNRIVRKVIQIQCTPPPVPPEAPEDSLLVTRDALQVTSEPVDEGTREQVTGDERQVTSELFYVERIADVEMKIFPNPASEKIFFEIVGENVGVENFRPLPVLRLYSLSGQLLQTQTIHSATVEISLLGLANGVYLLKVQIEGRTEEWKVVKN